MNALHSSLRVLVPLLLGAAPLSSRASAQSIRISGDLAPVRTGGVQQHLFTPDGSRFVYRADRAGNGSFELLSVPTDGSAPAQPLNGPLPPGGSVKGLVGLGTGGLVAYVADQTTQGTFELYSVPADGSASPTLLSPSMVSIGFLSMPAGGDFVLYSLCQGLDCTYYRVPLDGSAAPIPVIASFIVGGIQFSPDTSTTLFKSFGLVAGFDLYSVPSDGSAAPVLLDQVPGAFNDIRFASDGVHILYDETDEEGFFYHDLYSTLLDGSQAPVELDAGQLDYVGGYAIDSSSALDRAAYMAAGVVYSIAYDGTQRVALNPPGWTTEYSIGEPPDIAVRGPDVAFEATTATGKSILRAPLDGSQVGAPLFDPRPLGYVDQVEISASGRVVYLAEPSSTRGIFSVPLTGGTPVLLDPPQLPNRGPRSFQLSPNGQQVVYQSDIETPGKNELYVAPLDGSQAPVKLNAPLLPAGGDVLSFSFPDSQSVAYVADSVVDGLTGVFGAPLDGLGPVTQLNEWASGSAIGGDVLEFQLTADGKSVVFRADVDADESFDLFVAGGFGRGKPRKVTALLGASANVRPGFVLAPSGERVVFQSVEQSLFALHSATTAPGPAPIELDSSAIELPLPLGIAPDETRVVYRKSALGALDHALLSAPLDGSSPPAVLHAPVSTGRAVIDFQISPDSQFVVHRADEDLDNVFELFSVPLDGSAPAVRLHPPLVAGRSVTSYRISPDGEHVVFLADREVAGRLDLYSVPIDGSFAPRKLDQALLPTRDVLDFAISPDGRDVVYRANAQGQNQLDLYLVPIDGLNPPLRGAPGVTRKESRVRLSQLNGVRRVESDYDFTGDGAQVLFRISDPNITSKFDLFRVASDGSSAPVQLSEPLASNRTVSSFALSPDQSRVVYLSDAATNDVFELSSVPLAGGPVVRLDPLPAFADVFSYRIDPPSRRVVYQADRNADNVLELFDVPLDGSAPAERLNAPLPANGDVEADYVPLVGGRVLYRADQVTNDILELFVSLERPVLPR